MLGSKDETAGCQLCVVTVADDGSLTLRFRMPDCLAQEHGKYITIENVRFAYGQENVLVAPQSNMGYRNRHRLREEKAARATDFGQAIRYRFKRDAPGWCVFVTTIVEKTSVWTDRRLGVIGVDLNAGDLSVTGTDRSGTFVNAFSAPLVTCGKSSP